MVTDSLGEVVHELGGVLRGQQQLPLVGLGHAVTLEAILSHKQVMFKSEQQQLAVNASHTNSYEAN